MKALSKLKIGLIILAASLGLFLLAFYYYKSESDEIIKEKQEFLAAITNIKLEQIVKWRKDRISDAEFFPTVSSIIRNTAALNANKNNKEAHQYFSSSLKRFKANGYFENVFITDINGAILFSLDSSFNNIDQLRIDELKLAVEKDSVIIGDFYFSNTHNTIHFNIASIIKNNSGMPIGVYVQIVDPYKSLYPIIQTWPVSSKTAETLLFKKENDHIVYLNDLRHKKNSALFLKIKITESDIVAVKAVLGARGIIEGKDYRGKNVLANVKTVTSTDWFMVSKVDKDELYFELFFRASVISLIALFTILLTSLTALYIYKLQQSNIYKYLFLKEKELSETQEEYRTALYSIGDAVITTDTNGKIKRMNSVAETLTGWKEIEVRGKALSAVFNIINEETNIPAENPVNRVLKDGVVVGLANHTVLITKSGDKIPITDSGAPIHDDQNNVIGVILVFRDQTEEREKEKELYESNEKFLKLFRHSSDCISLTQISTGKLSEVNEGFEKLFGYTRSEAIGKTTFELGLWANPDDRVKMFEQLMQNGFIKNFEASGIQKKGNQITVLISGELLEFNNEPYLLLSLKDITERKIAEESLRKSKERYALVIDASNEGIFDWDIINDIGFVSEKYRQIHGLKGHTQKSMNEWISKVHPEDIDRITQDIENHYAGKTNISESEYRILDEKGGYKWVLGRAKASFNSEGKPIRVVGTVRDISDKKMAEEVIKDSEANLNALINNSKESIWSIDKNYNYIVFNNFFAEAYFATYNQNLVKGINALKILTPELKAFWKPKYDAALSGERIEFEFSVELSNGIKFFQVFLNPIVSDGAVTGVSALSVDVTDKKHAEKTLKENELRLQTIVSNAPVVLFGLDKNGIFTFSEGKGLQALGLKPGEVVGLSAVELYKDFPSAVEAIKRALKGEMNSALHDMGNLVFDVNYAPIKNEKGEILGIIGVANDITERKFAEEALRTKSAQMEAFLEHSPYAIQLFDLLGYCVYVNKAFYQLFPTVPPPYWSIFEDAQLLSAGFGPMFERLRQGETISLPPMWFKPGSSIPSEPGSERCVTEVVFPLLDSAGKIQQFALIGQDVSEQRRAEEALAKSEERLRLSLKAADQGLYDLNIQTGETIVNDEYALMLGYDPKTFKESNSLWIERLHPDDREITAKAYQDYIEGKSSEYRVEFRQKTVDNNWKWILSLGKIVEYDSIGKPIRMLGTHADITRRKKDEAELEFYNKRLKLISEITAFVVDAAYTKTTAEKMGRAIMESFEADAFMIRLIDGEDLIPFVFSGIPKEHIIPKISTKLGIAERMISSRKPFSVGKVDENNLTKPILQHHKNGFRFISYAGAPLLLQDKVLGILGIYDTKQPREYTTEDLAHLQIAANHIAAAFENYRLYENLNNQKTALEFENSERQKAESALQKSEETYRLTAEQTGLIVYDNDMKSNTTKWSGAIEFITGYSPDEFRSIVANDIYDNIDAEDKNIITSICKDAAKQGSNYQVEYKFRKKDGNYIYLEDNAAFLKDEYGNVVRMLGTLADITEKKKLFNDLKEAKENAEEMNRVKAYFFANMSHELRTPFVGIMGFSEMLSELLSNPAEKEMAEQILKSSKRLTETLNKILNVTRLEFDKVDLKLGDVDIVELVKQLTTLFSKSGTIKNTVIGSTFSPDVIHVRTDAKLVEEILTNLLNNAIKYTQDGAIEIVVKNTSDEKGDKLIITVADTGIGIPKEKQEIIWQEFRQASEGMNRSFEGTGLGLTIIKKYVNTLGGQISLESEVGRGSTFTVELPVTNTSEKETQTKLKKEPAKILTNVKQMSRKPRILYVEDDVIALSYVDKVLRTEYEIDTAFSAAIAIDNANKEKYEVVLLDINLGRGIDGVELMQLIRKIDGYAKIPMVAVTAYAADSDRIDFLKKGFTHYISKPFTKKELQELLNKIFD